MKTSTGYYIDCLHELNWDTCIVLFFFLRNVNILPRQWLWKILLYVQSMGLCIEGGSPTTVVHPSYRLWYSAIPCVLSVCCDDAIRGRCTYFIFCKHSALRIMFTKRKAYLPCVASSKQMLNTHGMALYCSLITLANIWGFGSTCAICMLDPNQTSSWIFIDTITLLCSIL